MSKAEKIEHSAEIMELSPENVRVMELANVLKAISHPARLCIVKNLYLQGICNVGYFTNCMGISQPNVSQHLSKLKDLGIVEVKKQGLESYYSLVNEDVKNLVALYFAKE